MKKTRDLIRLFLTAHDGKRRRSKYDKPTAEELAAEYHGENEPDVYWGRSGKHKRPRAPAKTKTPSKRKPAQR